MNKKLKRTIYPVLAAVIWGCAFVFQRVCSEHVQPFTLNALRCFLAVIALGIFLFLRRKSNPLPKDKEGWRQLSLGGLVCGTALFVSCNLQQYGIGGTEAGKAGFITSIYIVLVPLFGIFFGHKARIRVWLCIAVALVGLYFLCGGKLFTLETADLMLILCAITYAFYILAVDHYSKRNDNPVALCAAQFAVCAVFSLFAALLFEDTSWQAIRECTWDILYVGVMSSAVAYTLEFAAQKVGEPVRVTLLLSLESVFSVIFGFLLLHERLAPQELLGCAIMFSSVIWAQLPHQWWKPKEERT